MPEVTISSHPREHLPWRDFDHRLFSLLAQLATSRLAASRIYGIFDDAVRMNRDIGDPTDMIDDLLYAGRKHMGVFATRQPQPPRRQIANAQRYLP